MSIRCVIKGVSVRIVGLRHIRGIALAFVIVFVLSAPIYNQAAAIGTTKTSGFLVKPEETTSLQPSPSRVVVDSCLPLLHKVRHTSETATNSIRRPAGKKAATVGFVLGLRVALGPAEHTGANHKSQKQELSQSGNDHYSHALAVASYRKCKNEKELQAMGGKVSRLNQYQ